VKQLIFKELREFANSYFGIGSMALFIILTFVFLWVFPQSSFVSYGFSDPQNYFNFISFLILFIVPLISVGMITKEFGLGTFELLRTQHISWFQIVVSKFITLMIYITILLILTLIHIYILQQVSLGGNVIGTSQLVGSLIGIIMMAAVYAAISLCISSWIEHAILSIIVSVLVCFLFYTGFSFLSELESLQGNWGYALNTISLQWHADQLSKGVLYLFTIVYTLSLCLISLYGTVNLLKRKNF